MPGHKIIISADWRNAIVEYVAWCDAAGQSEQTIDLRARYLQRVAAAGQSGPWTTTLDELVAFMGGRSWAPETRKAARAAIRSFYRWAVRTGHLERDPAALLPPVRVPPAKPRPVPEDVLLRAIQGTNPRNRLMVLLGAFQGLRRGEIASLHTDDLVDTNLRIRGKGGRVRVLPAHPAIAVEIMSLPTGFVFPGAHRGHLSGDAVGKAMKRLLGPRWSAHTLRHRFASRAYAADRDIRAVQELLGHSKLETTQKYTAIPDGALRAAVIAAGEIAA